MHSAIVKMKILGMKKTLRYLKNICLGDYVSYMRYLLMMQTIVMKTILTGLFMREEYI